MLMHILLNWLITSLSLYIISRLPFGIYISGFGTAVISAAVFGLVNALLGPFLRLLALPLTVLTLGLFSLVVNAILFSVTAWLVDGFELRGRFSSALVGALLLSLVNAVLARLLFRF